ncbi:SAM-dependent chlorinase/fluorinase [candidate division KSB1 bacterium]|nr:SAM-dependent chlorinase/fluorinase [candidate division KSB1 bacterium]
MSKIITLLTDFGATEAFVGIMKGVILSINPAVQLVDLTHQIPPHQIGIGALQLNRAYRYFPAGTIHVAVVDPGVGSKRSIILVAANAQFFLAPDNGLLQYIFENHGVTTVTKVTNGKYFLPEISQTFHGRDIFAPVAGHLSRGVNPTEFGGRTRTFLRGSTPPLRIEANAIYGQIILIDHFGNLISNIPRSALPRNVPEQRWRIQLKELEIQGLSPNYADAPQQVPLALWSSWDTLEIAVFQARAATLLGVDLGTAIQIRWQ